MAFSEGDLKIFAAGLAIGGKWNNTGAGGNLPKPIAEPPAGKYYGASQLVLLKTNVNGAIIRYTIDGKDVEATGDIYNGVQILVDRDMVIKAFVAVKDRTSEQGVYRYVVTNPLDGLSDTADISEYRLTDGLSIEIGVLSINVEDNLEADVALTDGCNIVLDERS